MCNIPLDVVYLHNYHTFPIYLARVKVGSSVYSSLFSDSIWMNLLGFFPCVTEICFSPHLQFKGWAIVVLFTFQFPQEQRAEAGRWRRSLPELYRLALLHDLGSGLSSEILLNALV